MIDCQFVNRAVVPDGEGGVTTVWTDGAVFKAAVRLDSSLQAQVAAAQGVTGIYTIITPRTVNLQFHDVVRRLTDNKVFRVTSDGDDKRTPNSAGLDMRSVSAEEWVIPA